jgi:hypothetical protein
MAPRGSRHSCHSSRHSFGVIDWPGNSPDLNPIENLWSYIENKLKHKDISSGPKLIKEIKTL